MVVAPKRGDIYQVNWNPSRGSEQAGIRPALVVQHDVMNVHSRVTIVAAITSAPPKKRYPQEVPLPDGTLPKRSWVLCGQLITVSKDRLGRMMGYAPADTMSQVDEALHYALGMPPDLRGGAE
jgi:mRNA interferase MazF